MPFYTFLKWKYNLHMTLCKNKVYNMLMQCIYMYCCNTIAIVENNEDTVS